jgi:hypothetical protein
MSNKTTLWGKIRSAVTGQRGHATIVREQRDLYSMKDRPIPRVLTRTSAGPIHSWKKDGVYSLGNFIPSVEITNIKFGKISLNHALQSRPLEYLPLLCTTKIVDLEKIKIFDRFLYHLRRKIKVIRMAGLPPPGGRNNRMRGAYHSFMAKKQPGDKTLDLVVNRVLHTLREPLTNILRPLSTIEVKETIDKLDKFPDCKNVNTEIPPPSTRATLCANRQPIVLENRTVSMPTDPKMLYCIWFRDRPGVAEYIDMLCTTRGYVNSEEQFKAIHQKMLNLHMPSFVFENRVIFKELGLFLHLVDWEERMLTVLQGKTMRIIDTAMGMIEARKAEERTRLMRSCVMGVDITDDLTFLLTNPVRYSNTAISIEHLQEIGTLLGKNASVLPLSIYDRVEDVVANSTTRLTEYKILPNLHTPNFDISDI